MGFVHNGGLNSHLLNYKQMITDGEETEDIAKYMMVIMIKGLFLKLQFLYAQLPICGYHLYDILWEAVE